MKSPMRGFQACLARACHAATKFVGRLLAAMLVGHVFLAVSAHATIQATPLYTAYSIKYPFHVAWGPGLMPDANACITMYADWNAEIQSDPANFFLVGVEYVSFSGTYPYICSHNSIAPDGSKHLNSVWLQQTTNVCPANSTADTPNGWWCTCNAGFVQQANSCVRPDVASPTPNSCPAPDGLFKGQPIAPATGEKFSVDADWSEGGASPLSFVRTYRSGWTTDSARPQAGLGLVWSHNHYARLDATPIGDPTEVTIINPDGTLRKFAKTVGAGNWATANSSDTLTQLAGGAWSYGHTEDDSTLSFGPDGKVLSRHQRNGWTHTYAYNAAGRMASVTNPFGRSLTLSYNGAGQLTAVTLPDARVLTYGFDAQNRLSQATYADGKTRSYVYENAGLPHVLTGIVDEAGARWATFSYDSFGRATSTELAGTANRYQVSYGNPGTVNVTDPLNKFRSYSYGFSAGKLAVIGGSAPSETRERDAASRVQDSNGLVTSETDFKGIVTTTTWDTTRRLPIEVTRAVGTPEVQTVATQWHANFNLPVLISETGRTTAMTYDAQGNLLSRTVTDTANSPNSSKVWQWTYSAQSLVATQTAPNGAATSYGYDSFGNVLTETNALGHVTQYGYDSANRVVSRTEPNGLVTTFTWDARDRLLAQTAGGQPTTTFTYNPTGTLETASLSTGLVVSYSYDAAHRLTGWSNNRGESGLYTLDGLGNRTAEQIKDSAGNVARNLVRTVNSINRISGKTEGSNQANYFNYDANGELTDDYNGLNQRVAGYGRDGLRRIRSITNPFYFTATLKYNALDAVTEAKDFKGVATTYARDAQGNATVESSADTGGASTQYDALGLPSQITDALGQATTITRDALGRPTGLVFADGKTTTLRYDLSANSKGYLSEIVDRSGTTEYTRDGFGRVTLKKQTLANGSVQQVSYSYNPNGTLASIGYPNNGGLLTHSYDATGRLTGLSLNGTPLVTGIAWNPLGQPTAWTWAFASPSLAASRSYDTAGRMTATEFSNYVYDAAGRITSLTQQLYAPGDTDPTHSTIGASDITWTVGYNAVGRITGFNAAGSTAGFGYDANGNRSSSTRVLGTQSTSRSYTVGATSNRLTGFSQTINGASSTSVTYGYNANGDLVSDGLRSYTYDAEGRLAASTTGATDVSPTTRYAHNALGQRVFKTEPLYPPGPGDEADPGFMQSLIAFFTKLWNPTTNQAEQLGYAYVYDENGTLISEAGSGGANSAGQASYIYLPTANGPMPIAAVINGATYAVHSDHLNTPRKLSNADGQPVWQWSYSAFGEDKPTIAKNRFANLDITPNPGTTSVSEVKFNLRYPGQYADEESGLFYNYFRSYDARTGRYSQPDPIGLGGGWNRISYVSGNPLKFVDASGLQQSRMLRSNEHQLFEGGGGGGGTFGGGGGGLTLGIIGAGVAAAVGSNSVVPPTAANDPAYDNVVPLPPQSCPPDDGCKRAQDKLLNNRLLIGGLWSQGLLGNMGEYRRLAMGFNQSVEAHNARCPAHPVAPLPLGPF
jgi:RHS repeat-associated protein